MAEHDLKKLSISESVNDAQTNRHEKEEKLEMNGHDGQSNGLGKEGKMAIEVKVHLRLKDYGWSVKTLSMKNATLGALKSAIVKEQQELWVSFGYVLKENDIRVFAVQKPKARDAGDPKAADGGGIGGSAAGDGGGIGGFALVTVSDNAVIDPNIEYLALEYFSTVPFDMYRTVAVSQVFRCTFTHPSVLEEGALTAASPLYCASWHGSEGNRNHGWLGVGVMQVDEKKQAGAADPFPFLGQPFWEKDPNKKGRKAKAERKVVSIAVNGLSLFCAPDVAEDYNENPDHPFDPMKPDEKIGDTYVRAERFKELFVGDNGHDNIFGILVTGATHESQDLVSGVRSATQTQTSTAKRSPSQGAQANEPNWKAHRRCLYYRYKLKKDVDLSKYGLGLVFDQADGSRPRHCSLVFEEYPKAEGPAWIKNTSGIHVPAEYYVDIERLLGDQEGLKEVLGAALEPKPTLDQPEIMLLGVKTGEELNLSVVCPKLAAMFGLHDFKMSAMAEPTPPDGNDDPPRSLYLACWVLFRLDEGADEGVQFAIRDLVAVNYVADRLEGWKRLALAEAMEAVDLDTVDFDAEDMTSIQVDEDAARDAFSTAIEALKNISHHHEDAARDAFSTAIEALKNISH